LLTEFCYSDFMLVFPCVLSRQLHIPWFGCNLFSYFAKENSWTEENWLVDVDTVGFGSRVYARRIGDLYAALRQTEAGSINHSASSLLLTSFNPPLRRSLKRQGSRSSSRPLTGCDLHWFVWKSQREQLKGRPIECYHFQTTSFIIGQYL
jgi:hypothetical protein